MRGRFGDGFARVFGFGIYGVVHIVSTKKNPQSYGTVGGPFTHRTFLCAGQGNQILLDFSLRTLWTSMLAFLAIAAPLQARSDQRSILVPQECDARLNLQYTYVPDAAFSFDGL